MRVNKKNFGSLGLHMLAAWLFFNITSILPYLYRVRVHGNYLWKEDGTSTTAWDYFLLINYYIPNSYLLAVKVLIFIPLVEINLWYAIRKRSFAYIFLLAALTGLIMSILLLFPWNIDRFHNYPFNPLYDFAQYGGYSVIYTTLRKYIRERADAIEFRYQQLNNELHTLKTQLNPHFFFNSLNYVYGSALSEKADRTGDAVSALSDMMRYTISSAEKTFVPLAFELEFVENYIKMQLARIPDKEPVKIDIVSNDHRKEHYRIAPLLLLPFIENSFKYGFSIDHPYFIEIKITLNKGWLTMSVKNRIINERSERLGNNTGILTSRKRLDLLYPNKYTLELRSSDTEYTVDLELKLSVK